NKPYDSRFEATFNEQDGHITVTSPEPITIEDALKIAGVDEHIWEVTKVKAGGHQVTMKLKRGVGVSKKPDQPLQVWNQNWAVWVKRRVPRAISDAFDLFEQRLLERTPKPRARKRTYSVPQDACMLEVGLVDMHFGKLAWNRETENDYDLKIAEALFENAVEDILNRTAAFKFDKILMPIGSDMFHINDASFTTPTAHNNLDVDGRLAKIYEVGGYAAMRAIDRLLEIAPVDVVFVPGNHDQDIAYFLAVMLKVAYRNDDRITIDVEPHGRKYIEYGTNLLGLCHMAKKGTKPERMGGIMAGERAEAWARTKVHEWHVGHDHRRGVWDINATQEELGVRVVTLPSLTGTDLWHYDQGFVLQRRCAEAYVWSKTEGPIANFSVNAREDVGEQEA
ncbi:hypothetical protein OAF54_01045, partial [bacterium]|nr:hypothetical protein [bacterium]